MAWFTVTILPEGSSRMNASAIDAMMVSAATEGVMVKN
jgi:hypothetical protein